VVEGESPDTVIPALIALAEKLERKPQLFHAVLHRIDLSKLHAKGLYYLSLPDLKQLDQFLTLAEPIVQGEWARLQMGNLIGVLVNSLTHRPDELALSQLTQTLAALNAGLRSDGKYLSPWPPAPQPAIAQAAQAREYLLANDGKIGFVVLHLAPGKDPFAPGTEATDALRERIAQVQAKYPLVKVGLTGLPVMENDEMRTSKASMTWATILSLAAVTLILVAAFGGLRHALLANVALVIAMCWSFGFATIAIGHLNILSVVFTVTLNGLGIDYGLYYCARYLQKREQGLDTSAALRQALWEIGPAVTIGACTTAAGFFAAVFTTFTGIAELGIIAGSGILLCLIAQLYVLPAMILLVDRGALGRLLPRPLQVTGWVTWILKSPRQVVGFVLAVSLMLGIGATQLRYDHNLLNLQAKGLESIELEKRLLSECRQSMWFALSVADTPEELLARKSRMEQLATVERCEEIASLIPPDAVTKTPLIDKIHRRVANLPAQVPHLPVDQPATLVGLLQKVQQIVPQTPLGIECVRHSNQLVAQISALSLTDFYSKLSDFQQRAAGDLLGRLAMLAAAATPQPPSLADLPEPITQRFRGQSGKHLLRIYGRGNIWDMDTLRRFITDVRRVDPQVTGNPVQTYESSQEVKRSYELAVLYSLAVIVTIIAIDLRSLFWTLVALMPLGLGVLVMLGIMGLVDMPLNAANMIALPLILGIGVDYGLHVIYDYRQQGQRQISPSTILAVTVDALTSSVGFGSMMIASHQGLQSLGRVLTIGTTACLCIAIFFLPALLKWIRGKDPGVSDEMPMSGDDPSPSHPSLGTDASRYPLAATA